MAAIEEIHDSAKARLIGVSNFSADQLQSLCDKARIRPRFVQHRCYASRGWDRRVRAICSANGIVYQGFSLPTANEDALAHADMVGIARRHGRSVSQIVFRFAIDVGMVPLTGTTDVNHMRDDLDIFAFRLEPHEIEQIENLAVAN